MKQKVVSGKKIICLNRKAGFNYFFLELKINKNDCMKRVVQRDLNERGKAKNQAEDDFLKSWDIYYEKFKNKNIKENVNEFTITRNTNIDQILKKLL